jgi:hypothetical protein
MGSIDEKIGPKPHVTVPLRVASLVQHTMWEQRIVSENGSHCKQTQVPRFVGYCKLK